MAFQYRTRQTQTYRTNVTGRLSLRTYDISFLSKILSGVGVFIFIENIEGKVEFLTKYLASDYANSYANI